MVSLLGQFESEHKSYHGDFIFDNTNLKTYANNKISLLMRSKRAEALKTIIQINIERQEANDEKQGHDSNSVSSAQRYADKSISAVAVLAADKKERDVSRDKSV